VGPTCSLTISRRALICFTVTRARAVSTYLPTTRASLAYPREKLAAGTGPALGDGLVHATRSSRTPGYKRGRRFPSSCAPKIGTALPRTQIGERERENSFAVVESANAGNLHSWYGCGCSRASAEIVRALIVLDCGLGRFELLTGRRASSPNH
jgi:hypothetical protein